MLDLCPASYDTAIGSAPRRTDKLASGVAPCLIPRAGGRKLLALVLLLGALRLQPADGFSSAEIPQAPQSIETAYLGARMVRVYWSHPLSPECSGYQIVRDGSVVATLGLSDCTWNDTNAEPGSTHRYAVNAQYPAGKSAISHTVSEKVPPAPQRTRRYDVVVVSASSAGVAAAVTAARDGLHVALVEETDRLGGIMSNGLCSTDIRRPAHSTGFFEEFRKAVVRYYGGGTGLAYEPHVVNNVLKSFVAADPHIDLYLKTTIDGVSTSGSRVTGVHARLLDTGQKIDLYAPITIDADPSGDVAAHAGCRFRVGREARSQDEPHAGVIYYWRTKDELLPGSTGRGDHRLMAYAYLAVVKDYGPGADRTIARPPAYRESDFVHSPPWRESWAVTSGAMPGHKYELNQHPQGNDLQEVNYDWPRASAHRRARIEQAYHDHALGYLYYLQTHEGQKNLGLPDDEFPENDGFPETLYVREARRIVGLANLTEADVTDAASRLRPDSAGIGDYPMDSHAVRVKSDWDRPDMGEGEYWLYRYTPWYQIPVGVTIPADRDGLLVAEAVSASHVGYGTLRLEPVRMELGALCGELAALKVLSHIEPRDVPASMLEDNLTKHGQEVFWHADAGKHSPHSPAIQFMSSHGFWTNSVFEGGQAVTQQEASTALLALARLEIAQSRLTAAPISADGSGGDRPGRRGDRESLPESEGESPNQMLTRGALAARLVRTESALREDWSPQDGGSAAHTVAHIEYPDLPAGTAVRRYALLLLRHHITVDSWRGTRFDASGVSLFDPGAPVCRADLAEALFLAQRDFQQAFYDHRNIVVPTLPNVPAPRTP